MSRRALRCECEQAHHTSNPPVVAVSTCRLQIGMDKILALEQKGLASRLGEGIGQAIAEVELCGVTRALAEIPIGVARNLGLFRGDSFNFDARLSPGTSRGRGWSPDRGRGR